MAGVTVQEIKGLSESWMWIVGSNGIILMRLSEVYVG